MRLEFSGHRAVRVQLGTEDQVRQIAGDPRGGFRHNGEWNEQDDVLTVTFSPIIRINQTLDANLRRRIEQHERRHFNDFKRLAEQLRVRLRQLLKDGRDADMEARWSWFEYDICATSASFHRSLPDWSVELCFQPRSTRPD